MLHNKNILNHLHHREEFPSDSKLPERNEERRRKILLQDKSRDDILSPNEGYLIMLLIRILFKYYQNHSMVSFIW